MTREALLLQECKTEKAFLGLLKRQGDIVLAPLLRSNLCLLGCVRTRRVPFSLSTSSADLYKCKMTFMPATILPEVTAC